MKISERRTCFFSIYNSRRRRW